MTARLIARIKEIDAQIAQIDALLKNGTCVAAGLDISVHVGPARDRAPALRMQTCFEVEPLLELMRQSLVRSRASNLSHMRHDLRNIDAYLTPAKK